MAVQGKPVQTLLTQAQKTQALPREGMITSLNQGEMTMVIVKNTFSTAILGGGWTSESIQ